jgi:hypothetical protein
MATDAEPQGFSSKLEHYGRGRDYRSSSVLAFRMASVGVSYLPPRKHRRAGRDELVLAVPATFVASVLTRSQILAQSCSGLPGAYPR